MLTRRLRLGHCEKALFTAITANSHFTSLVSFPLLLFRVVFIVPPVTSCGSPFLSFSDSAGSLSVASSTSCSRVLSVLLQIVTVMECKREVMREVYVVTF